MALTPWLNNGQVILSGGTIIGETSVTARRVLSAGTAPLTPNVYNGGTVLRQQREPGAHAGQFTGQPVRWFGHGDAGNLDVGGGVFEPGDSGDGELAWDVRRHRCEQRAWITNPTTNVVQNTYTRHQRHMRFIQS